MTALAAALAAALVCGSLGGFIAWHYPIAPLVMVLAFVAAVAATFLRPRLWLAAVPALIPLIGFAPWTGWLVAEEVDLLVLGTAAGAYARLAVRGMAPRDATSAAHADTGNEARFSVVAIGLIALFALSSVVALYRGFADAGGIEGGWFDGYYDALNSVRIGKSLALALVLAPLMLVELRRAGDRVLDYLAAGFAAGSGVAAIAVVWERAAFPQLLDFSSDYRATGMFWEMHVGGAALDGFLALSVPFVIWACMNSRGRRSMVTGGLALLVSYACLATFSRGVYLAIPVSLSLLALLHLARTRTLPQRIALIFKGALLIAAIAAASFLVFRAGGYRSLLAVLGVMAVSLPLSSMARGASLRQWGIGFVVGGVLAALGAGLAAMVPKGPYVVFALVLAGCVWLGWARQPSEQRDGHVAMAVPAYVWLSLAAAMIALHWGGESALRDTSIVLLSVLVLVALRARSATPAWPNGLREQGIVVALATVIGAAVAVMSGGAYMGDRFAASQQDFGGRIQHWRDGLGLLSTPTEWLLGKGLGRFPKNYFFSVREAVFPGGYRIANENGNGVLILSGPRYPSSFGDLFRVAQRVPATRGPHVVTFDARAPAPAQLHIEICEQHLLYNAGCAIAAPAVTVSGDTWQRHVVVLDGSGLQGGPWYAPRLAFFSLAVESMGRRVDLDNVALTGPGGRNLLENGDFDRSMAHWFIISERHHLPWHIKNLAFNVLFEQGAVGLVLFTLLVGGSLWRLIAGRARGHPMAPFLAAALVGFLIVGAFDSLLDVPRVALAFYLLVLVGLALREPRHVTTAQPG